MPESCTGSPLSVLLFRLFVDNILILGTDLLSWTILHSSPSMPPSLKSKPRYKLDSPRAIHMQELTESPFNGHKCVLLPPKRSWHASLEKRFRSKLRSDTWALSLRPHLRTTSHGPVSTTSKIYLPLFGRNHFSSLASVPLYSNSYQKSLGLFTTTGLVAKSVLHVNPRYPSDDKL